MLFPLPSSDYKDGLSFAENGIERPFLKNYYATATHELKAY